MGGQCFIYVVITFAQSWATFLSGVRKELFLRTSHVALLRCLTYGLLGSEEACFEFRGEGDGLCVFFWKAKILLKVAHVMSWRRKMMVLASRMKTSKTKKNIWWTGKTHDSFPASATQHKLNQMHVFPYALLTHQVGVTLNFCTNVTSLIQCSRHEQLNLLSEKKSVKFLLELASPILFD